MDPAIASSMADVDENEDDFSLSRNYFLSKEMGSSSAKKSARRISEIAVVDEQVLRAAVSAIVPKHEKESAALTRKYADLYSKWLFELRCGFGLLMYGFGSKKFLLEDFATTTLTDYAVVVINGHLPSVNLKQVVVTVAELLFDQQKGKRKGSTGSKTKLQPPFNSHTMDDILSFLNDPSADQIDCFICIVIHNIDGPSLRDADSQLYLARLASCSHVRIVASMDHVNTPLLWDKKMVHTQFNWCWYHVPTFAPYDVEGIFLPLILANAGNVQTTKTALIVLQSLTPNAQSVFRILAEYQLANEKEEGMPVNALYTKCRERFLVSSQVTLNSHLTEFKDHELVKTRRHSDGQDCLHIPLSSEALEKLLQELV